MSFRCHQSRLVVFGMSRIGPDRSQQKRTMHGRIRPHRESGAALRPAHHDASGSRLRGLVREGFSHQLWRLARDASPAPDRTLQPAPSRAACRLHVRLCCAGGARAVHRSFCSINNRSVGQGSTAHCSLSRVRAHSFVYHSHPVAAYDMPDTRTVPVSDLTLDLSNFRTVKQKSEIAAVQAIIATSPDRFWALADSLLTDGFLPTENILVLRSGRGGSTKTVKEGNRRVAALKLLHGLIPASKLAVPDDFLSRLRTVSREWRTANATVPCAIYTSAESEVVDRIVRLAHGKGEKAGRDQWNAVARARHNRDVNGAAEPALDLLEAYLLVGQNLTSSQKARWSGDYPVTILAEAIKRIAPRLGLASAKALAKAYPKVPHRDGLEAMLADIGLKELRFELIRAKNVDFGARFAFPRSTNATQNATPNTTNLQAGKVSSGGSRSTHSAAASGPSLASNSAPSKPKALSLTDPKAVQRQLKTFVPRGKGREKVVALKEEAARLDVGKTPLAFSFILRSMFEISAKVYCNDHATAGGPSTAKKDGSDRPLAEVLRDIVKQLTKNNTDRAMMKAMHGAMTELATPDSLLSVTSLNQLVHNPRFAISSADVAIRFGNVFPLLEEMNK